GKYTEAETALTDLLNQVPGDPEVCRLLAMLHLKRGELAVAKAEFQFLAEAAMRAKEYEIAESMLGEYLKTEPKCVALHELLGRDRAASRTMRFGTNSASPSNIRDH